MVLGGLTSARHLSGAWRAKLFSRAVFPANVSECTRTCTSSTHERNRETQGLYTGRLPICPRSLWAGSNQEMCISVHMNILHSIYLVLYGAVQCSTGDAYKIMLAVQCSTGDAYKIMLAVLHLDYNKRQHRGGWDGRRGGWGGWREHHQVWAPLGR